MVVHRHRNFDTHQPIASPAQIARPTPNPWSYFYVGCTSTLFFTLFYTNLAPKCCYTEVTKNAHTITLLAPCARNECT